MYQEYRDFNSSPVPQASQFKGGGREAALSWRHGSSLAQRAAGRLASWNDFVYIARKEFCCLFGVSTYTIE